MVSRRPAAPRSRHAHPTERDEQAQEITPSPARTCPYGCGTRCAEIRATRPDAWAALHHADPKEVERRNTLATAEMYVALGRTLRNNRPCPHCGSPSCTISLFAHRRDTR
jgi:hypothetical protein